MTFGSGSLRNARCARRNFPGNRSDIGWSHGSEVDSDGRKIRCNYCNKTVTGGVFHFKNHLADTKKDMGPCDNVLENVKQRMLDVLVSNLIATEQKNRRNATTSMNEVTEEDDMFKRSKTTQVSLNQMLKKDAKEDARRQIARFFYTSAIPFNCVNNPKFGKLCDLIANHGRGFESPSYHDIRVKYLKKEVDLTKGLIEQHKIQ